MLKAENWVTKNLETKYHLLFFVKCVVSYRFFELKNSQFSDKKRIPKKKSKSLENTNSCFATLQVIDCAPK